MFQNVNKFAFISLRHWFKQRNPPLVCSSTKPKQNSLSTKALPKQFALRQVLASETLMTSMKNVLEAAKVAL